MDDVAELLRRAHVLLLTDSDGGRTDLVLEAAATAVPTVAWDGPGTRDAISADVTGILCQPGDASAYAEAVATLLDDPVLARGMARRRGSSWLNGSTARSWRELLGELLCGTGERHDDRVAVADRPACAEHRERAANRDQPAGSSTAPHAPVALGSARVGPAYASTAASRCRSRSAACSSSVAMPPGRRAAAVRTHRVFQHSIDRGSQMMESAVERDHSPVDAVLHVLDGSAAIGGNRPHPRSAASDRQPVALLPPRGEEQHVD